MEQLTYPILSTLIFLPIAGAFAILLVPRSQEVHRQVARPVHQLCRVPAQHPSLHRLQQGDGEHAVRREIPVGAGVVHLLHPRHRRHQRALRPAFDHSDDPLRDRIVDGHHRTGRRSSTQPCS
ncbi:MAG: hypothetical protein MZU95_10125 [Desulfomicrobium escambiense]|nr:hypothetical protein [Desulfomicrobium escambiense]